MSLTTPVPSPCVDVCRMDAERAFCEGCLRNIAEITAWSKLSDDGKRAIWQLIDARRAQRSAGKDTDAPPFVAP